MLSAPKPYKSNWTVSGKPIIFLYSETADELWGANWKSVFVAIRAILIFFVLSNHDAIQAPGARGWRWTTALFLVTDGEHKKMIVELTLSVANVLAHER